MKKRLTSKDWQSAREVWESDQRDGYAWLVRELELPVSRAAVSKRGTKEGWQKQVTAEAPEVTQEVTQVTLNSRSATSSATTVGRPTDYKPEFADMAYRLMLLGFTRQGLADVFGVDERTIYRWQEEHGEFCQALFRGGAIADAEIAESLFNRAKGSVVPDTHVGLHEGVAIITPLDKHFPPDVGAARMWLKNRQPHLWKDKVEIVEEVISTFPPTDELDALYAKALKEAGDRQKSLFGRAERLGLVLDGELGREDEVIVRDEWGDED